MNTNKVANEKHFQVLQEKDENFAKAILRMKNLEQVKATIYQKHFEKPYIGLEARIKEFESEFECCDGIEQCYRCDNNEALVGYATALQVIRTIAKENDLRLRDMLNDIFMNLNMQSDKKKTIFFIGGSDAGKSVISELFLAHYDDYEIGNFTPPNKHAPNAFPFAGLCGAQIYKASEWFMDNLGVVQKMKTLLEGNSDMSIERKYKQDISLKPRPVWICGNGARKEDITMMFSKEYKAFENRCHIYFMHINLRLRFQEGSIGLMLRHKKKIMRKLYRDWKEEEKYTEYHNVNMIHDIVNSIENED